MCGILGVYVKNNKNNIVYKALLDIFLNQESRGTKGAGLLLKRPDEKEIRIRETHPTILLSCLYKKFWENIKENDIILFHHRQPTSNNNHYNIKSNHPFRNEKGVYLIHNGVIYEHRQIYKKLKKEGHIFESEINGKITDSEILAHYIENIDNEKQIKKCVKKIHKKLDGSLTFAFIVPNYHNIYLYRNGYSVFIYKDKYGNFYFSSEQPKWAIKPKELNDGELWKIDQNGYYMLERFKIRTWFKPFKSFYNWDVGWYGRNKKRNVYYYA